MAGSHSCSLPKRFTLLFVRRAHHSCEEVQGCALFYTAHTGMANSQTVVSALYAKVVADVIAKSRVRVRRCRVTSRGHLTDVAAGGVSGRGPGRDRAGGAACGARGVAARCTFDEAHAALRSAGSASSRRVASPLLPLLLLLLPRPRRRSPLGRCAYRCLTSAFDRRR